MLSIAMFLCVMSYGTIGISNDKGTVAELITEYRTAADVRSVFYQPEGETRLREVFSWASDDLFSYLASLDVEELNSVNEINNISGQRLSIVVSNNDTMELTFHDKFIEVNHYNRRSYPKYYYLRSELDWSVINGYLDLNAERPKESMVRDLQMYVHFDVEEQVDPIVAVRHHFRAWDIETGETLRSSVTSDPAGGLHGLSPTQALLLFEIPVSEITVWVQEWDSAPQEMIPLEVEEGNYFPLKDYSAHYRVDVVYEPDSGICYEATYVFDVEYPV